MVTQVGRANCIWSPRWGGRTVYGHPGGEGKLYVVRYMEKELYNNRLHDNVHEQQMNKSKCPNKLPLFIWGQTALLAL